MPVHLLELTNLQGELRWPNHAVDVNCTITIAGDGTINVTTTPITLNKATTWFTRHHRRTLRCPARCTKPHSGESPLTKTNPHPEGKH